MTNILTGVVSMITLRYMCAHWLVLIVLGSGASMASSHDIEAGAQADDNKLSISNEPHEKTGNSYLPGIGISAPAALPSFGLASSVGRLRGLWLDKPGII